jgi:Flp pilus assembly protein TadG
VRVRGERGATTELVVLFPAFFVLLFLGIQFALYFHASHVALAAAQEGARELRVTGNVHTSEELVDTFLLGLRQGALVHGTPQGRVDQTNGIAHMEVTGTAQSILPGFTFKVHEQSQGPVEVFRGDVRGR